METILRPHRPPTPEPIAPSTVLFSASLRDYRRVIVPSRRPALRPRCKL